MKFIFFFLFFVIILTGCVNNDSTTESVIESNLGNLNDKNAAQNKSVAFFYSNEIANPYGPEKYFIRRDKGVDQCAIIGSIAPVDKECILSPYQNENIGICGQDRYDNDPNICELMVRHPDGAIYYVADLIKPDYIEEAISDFENYYSEGIITGAELIKFVDPDKIVIFFGYDFTNNHRGTIAFFDLKTKKLSKPIIDYYWEGDHSFFGITKRDKTLIFMNKYDLSSTDATEINGVEENGIYLKVGDLVKKVVFPDVYDFGKLPFIDLNVRENYQNDAIAVMSINDKEYIFDFNKEIFIK
jgi:hypothetical protein